MAKGVAQPSRSVVPRSAPAGRGPWLLVGLLAAIQVGYAWFWLETSKAQRREELLSETARLHAEVGANLRALYESGRQHARNLAAQPATARFCDSSPGDPRAARSDLETASLAYLLSFDAVDRITITDRDGRERFRVERMGGGVGSLPDARLGAVEWLLDASARHELDRGEVFVSSLEYEDERVEVRDADREVLYYAAPIRGCAGYVIVTVYASPLLSAVRTLAPLEGSVSALCDELGLRALNQGAGPRSRAIPEPTSEMIRSARLADWGTATHGPLAGGHAWRARISDRPRVDLVTYFPAASIVSRLAPWTRGGVAVVVSLVITLALLAGVFVSTLALRRRAWLKEEIERLALSSRLEADRQRQLLEHSVDAVLLLDPSTLALRQENEATRRLFGVATRSTPSALASLRDLFPVGIPEELGSVMNAARAEPGNAVSSSIFGCVTVDRRELALDARAVVLTLGDGSTLLVALRDRTLEHQGMRRLMIEDRLSSIGLVAAGFAHEINNPLEGIGNYLSLAERDDVEPGARTRYLQLVSEGFRQIRDLVRDLLTYGQSGRGAESADVAQVVKRSIRLVQMSPRFRGVEVLCEGLDQPVGVRAEPGRLGQVFFNLLINAATAMDGKGTIRVGCSLDLDRGVWVVQVDDNGPGLREEALGRLFDPFYTTTEGSGLGLFISYGIVKAMGGDLTAGNLAGGGARFTVLLSTTESDKG